MSYTNTNSHSSSWTDARANHVMGKVYENLIGLKNSGLITMERADEIRTQVLYLLSKKALKFFELQLINSKGTKIGGFHYEVFSSGYVYVDEDSKDENYWRLSNDVRVKLFVSIDYGSSRIDEVKRQLEIWGYGIGKRLPGVKEELRSYAKDGYGLKQSKIGNW